MEKYNFFLKNYRADAYPINLVSTVLPSTGENITYAKIFCKCSLGASAIAEKA